VKETFIGGQEQKLMINLQINSSAIGVGKVTAIG
jgi:hypothetical protein